MWQLTAKFGKHRGASWPIGDRTLTVGRSPECDVVVRDNSVSRAHCQITQSGQDVVCEDLGSTNLTLNGKPVRRSVLRMGDEIMVGSAIFIVTRIDARSPDSPTPVNDATTVAMLGDIPCLRRDAREIAAIPRHVRDLAVLHELVGQLHACGNQEELATAVSNCLHANLLLGDCWIWCGSCRSDYAVYPRSARISDTCLTCLAEAESLDVPVRVQAEELGSSSGGSTWLVPMQHRGTRLGSLCMWLNRDSAGDVESDIGFAWCVARVAAAFLNEWATGAGARSDTRREQHVEATFVGASACVAEVHRLIGLAARVELPVLLQGETGTGKELIARLLHRNSARASKPFVAVNCATLPEGLFESELFGHMKGAFTGASQARKGLIAQAEGGVLFLDEITSLSRAGQAGLLRAIESATYRPIGGEQELNADVWWLAAANGDISVEIAKGTFRDDLYYRMSGIEIHVPPLRDRRADIPLLLDYFLAQFEAEKASQAPTVSDDAREFLAGQPWPGNVRELRNCVHRLAARYPGVPVTAREVETVVHRVPAADGSPARRARDAERAHIRSVLQETGGRIGKAASILGMHRNTLREKIKQYGL